MLPYHLWDIAERLARVAEARASHKHILDDVAPDDPDVAVVTRQPRAQALALAVAARRVSDLENFATRVDRRRPRGAQGDDRAGASTPSTTSTRPAGRHRRHRPGRQPHRPATNDATAVIDQASQAIEQANEAG